MGHYPDCKQWNSSSHCGFAPNPADGTYSASQSPAGGPTNPLFLSAFGFDLEPTLSCSLLVSWAIVLLTVIIPPNALEIKSWLQRQNSKFITTNIAFAMTSSTKMSPRFTRDSCTGRYCWERVLGMAILSVRQVCHYAVPNQALQVRQRLRVFTYGSVGSVVF